MIKSTVWSLGFWPIVSADDRGEGGAVVSTDSKTDGGKMIRSNNVGVLLHFTHGFHRQ